MSHFLAKRSRLILGSLVLRPPTFRRTFFRTAPTLNSQTPAKASHREAASRENLITGHSKFIADAHQDEDWPDENGTTNGQKGLQSVNGERSDVRGRLLPTATHLFKLVLPLPGLRAFSKTNASQPPENQGPPPPTVFLLHPSQPLSHISRLIQASLPSPTHGPQPFTPRLPTVSFQNDALDAPDGEGGPQQWSDSTDIGDFVKEAAHTKEFTIVITPDQATDTAQLASSDGQSTTHNTAELEGYTPLVIPVSVPSFEERTRYLRTRLSRLRGELKGMQEIKDNCDALARRGTRRAATGVFIVLVSWWLAVFRLTFFSAYGWDTMEPVTYLTEFLVILAGYLWFLRQGREVSYSSILNQSLSNRRRTLYSSHGLDIERWADLVTEEKAVQKEIERIREDYEGGWKESKKPKEEKQEKDKIAATLGTSAESPSRPAKVEPILVRDGEAPKEGSNATTAETAIERERESVEDEDERRIDQKIKDSS